MVPNRCVLIEADGRWRIGMLQDGLPETSDLEVNGQSDAHAIAGCVASALQERQLTNVQMVLGIASHRCLASEFQVEGRLAADQTARDFALETELPVSAEDVLTDYVHAGDTTMGIAVEAEFVKELVAALESQAITVVRIVPTAILGLQQFLASIRDEDVTPDVVVWEQGESIDVFGLAQNRLRRWDWLPADPAATVLQLACVILSQNPTPLVACVNTSECIRVALAALGDIGLRPFDRPSLEQSAVQFADKSLARRDYPWVDFRRQALPPEERWRHLRRPLRFAWAATVAFFVALAVGLIARGNYYGQIVQRTRTEQRAIFQEVFPQQNIPVGIRTRLESEHAKLAGMTGQQSELPDSVSAITTLHRVLASLPEGLPYRLTELRIEESGSVDLSAEVRTHGDGNQLASSLESGSLQVQPPQSRQLQSNLVAVEIAANLTP